MVPCLDVQHELETVARAVKTHLLEGGTAPGRIAVAFRDFAPVAGPLRGVFREFAFPAAFGTVPRSAKVPRAPLC